MASSPSINQSMFAFPALRLGAPVFNGWQNTQPLLSIVICSLQVPALPYVIHVQLVAICCTVSSLYQRKIVIVAVHRCKGKPISLVVCHHHAGALVMTVSCTKEYSHICDVQHGRASRKVATYGNTLKLQLLPIGKELASPPKHLWGAFGSL